MTHAHALKAGLVDLGRAVRRPERLAERWRDREDASAEAPTPLVFPLLIVNAVIGVAVYGFVMRMHGGLPAMLEGAVRAPLAAGLAWTLTLPALYVVGRALGSRLDPSTMLLAASITVSFGALAMLAAVPVTWFFELALPIGWVRVAVNLVVFAAVAVAMTDVFLRVMKTLDPDGPAGFLWVWLTLLGVMGTELFILLEVFRF